jgi:hypothetical protein
LKNIIFKKSFCLIVLVLMLSFFVSGCSSAYLVNKTSENLSNYIIDATFNESDYTLDVKQTVEYRNSSNVILNNLKFNLFAKAFAKGATNKPVGSLNEAKAYPNGKSYGDIEFSKIETNGQALVKSFEQIDKNILNIALLEPLKKGYCVSVDMHYKLTLPNIHHRFGYGENTVNLGNFFPIACVIEESEFVIQPYSSNGDPFYSDLANYLVNITMPNSYTLATTGSQTKVENLENTKKTTAKAKSVRDFAAVMSKKFEVKTQKIGKTQVLYYYYDDEKAEESLLAATKALKTYNKLIGEYPYSTLSVVKTNFVHGGMEYPNLVYVSDNLNNYEDYLNVIVHEIAHQWWYAVVGNNAYKYGWLDEGLTEYSTALFYEFNPEYNIKREDIIKNALTAYNMFTKVYEGIFGSVDTSLARTLSEYKTEPEYVYMAYVKSMLMFDDLRDTIGDRKFFNSLKKYYEQNKMQNVSPKVLINSFKKSSNRNLDSWFDSWISGKVIIKELD